MDILLRPKHVARLVALIPAWALCGMIFFGFNMARAGFFTDNAHVNLVFPSIIDALALLSAAAACWSSGKLLPVTLVFLVLNGLAICLVAAALPYGQTLALVVLVQISSLFSGGACWSLLWLVTALSFPKGMRWGNGR